MTPLDQIGEIRFPAVLYDGVVGHARRKLAGRYLPAEEQAPKAYGLLGGSLAADSVEVTHVFPLRRNLRDRPDLKPHVDRMMEEWAVPSETPLERRGWVSDPREVLAAQRECDDSGSVLFGAYHMHRVPWAHDPLRDTCTAIDTCLAQGSGLWALILSMVDPERPILRAFFEGDNGQEAPIVVVDEAPANTGEEASERR